jgi:MFS family permease
VPPSLFRHRYFTYGNGATLFIYGAFGLASLVPAVYVQQVLGLPATLAAVIGLPSTILMIALSGRFGALAGRFGPRPFMTAGPLVAAAGTVVWACVGLVPAADDGGRVALVVAGMIVLGLGIAITVAPLTAAVLGAVPESESGIGSAVNNAVARVAGLVTTACAGLVLGGAVETPGFVRAALVCAALLAVGGAISFAGIRGRPGD